MKKYNKNILLSFIFLIICTALNSFASLTKDPKKNEVDSLAESYIGELPDRTLSLPYVIKIAILKANSFKVLAMNLLENEASRASLDAMNVWKLNGLVRTFRDDFDTTNPFRLERGNLYSVGLEKYWETGTQTSLGFSYFGDNNFSISQSPVPIKFMSDEVKLQFSLTQSLVKDFMGQSSKAIKNSLMSSLTGQDLQFLVDTEDYIIQISNVYYNAWMGQKLVLAGKKNVTRFRRLYDITSRKKKLGIVERQDLLQVQNNLVNAKTNLIGSENSLKDIWTKLVINLGMPRALIDYSPSKVPLELDSPVDKAIQLCENKSFDTKDIIETYQLKSIRLQKKAIKGSIMSSKISAGPDVLFSLNYGVNGIDLNQKNAFSELQANNDAWSAQISFLWSLGASADKAEYIKNRVLSKKLEIQESSLADQIYSDWRLSCNNILSQRDLTKQYEKNFRAQKSRAQLEEDRFSLGRGQIINIVQAQNDASLAEVAYYSSQVSERILAWNILKLNGTIVDDFLELVNCKIDEFGSCLIERIKNEKVN